MAIAAAGTAMPRFNESGNWLITARLPVCTLHIGGRGRGTRLIPRTLPLFGDGADLLFVDEEVRPALTREANHALVEVLNPPGDALPIAQFYCDGYLLFPEAPQVRSFLSG